MPRQATLADTQGEQAADNRPPEEQAGTVEHLGGPRPYEGVQANRERPDELPGEDAKSSSSGSGSSGSGSSGKGSSGGSSSK
jgi:hypothetical protein